MTDSENREYGHHEAAAMEEVRVHLAGILDSITIAEPGEVPEWLSCRIPDCRASLAKLKGGRS